MNTSETPLIGAAIIAALSNLLGHPAWKGILLPRGFHLLATFLDTRPW